MFGLGLGKLGLVGGKKTAAFSPLSLFANSEQGAWYDPSDFSTMFQDSAGTTPVTAVGQTVKKILDRSGRGNHASQSDTAKSPVLRQDANSKYYLEFDGVDDSLATAAIDFTATDKISLFNGVRKESNATQLIAELSVNAEANNGAFHIGTYSIPDNYILLLRGSLTTNGYSVTTFVQPITNVISCNFDLTGTTTATEIFPRVNAVVPTKSTLGGGTNAGVGPFGNYPLYIGARAGSSFRFVGRIYSLIVRGALSTTQEITDTETWVNSKTGAY